MNIPEKLTKEEARTRLIAIDADPDAIDWNNVRADLARLEAEAVEQPDLLEGLPVDGTLAILRAHVAYLDAASETAGGDVTYIVWTAPEPEAGLNGERAEVHLFGANAEDDASVRKGLAETFGWIWGLAARHVHVDVAEQPEPEPVRVAAPPTGKPTTADGARAVLLAAAHDACEALKTFEDVMAEHADAKVGEDVARPMMAIRSAVNGALGMIEGRLPPVERTPEVVLRAMLRAYEAHAETFGVAYYAAGKPEEDRALKQSTVADNACGVVREMLFMLRAGRSPMPLGPIGDDYEARLRGDRPLDAPPMG